MIGGAHEQRDRLQQHLLDGAGVFSGELPVQCTFSPKINSNEAYKILGNRNGGTQVKHAKSSALKRARSFEAN